MSYLHPTPTIKKVRVYAGGCCVQEEDVNVDGFVADKFPQVFKEYNYVYIKSEKALAWNSVPEHRLRKDIWFRKVLERLDLLNESVIEIWTRHTREVRIYGGADDEHSNDKYWAHEEEVDVDKTCGEVLAPVFAMYNYVQIKTPVGHDETHIRLKREMYLKDAIAELGLPEGVIEIQGFNIRERKRKVEGEE